MSEPAPLSRQDLDTRLAAAQAAWIRRFVPEANIRRIRWSGGSTQLIELGPDGADRRLLHQLGDVIDDVFDSGRSIEAFLRELEHRCRANMPQTVRIATVYYKPSRNKTALKPDFWVHETEDWLVFPHEINGLSKAEIRAHKPGAEEILREG